MNSLVKQLSGLPPPTQFLLVLGMIIIGLYVFSNHDIAVNLITFIKSLPPIVYFPIHNHMEKNKEQEESVPTENPQHTK